MSLLRSYIIEHIHQEINKGYPSKYRVAYKPGSISRYGELRVRVLVKAGMLLLEAQNNILN